MNTELYSEKSKYSFINSFKGLYTFFICGKVFSSALERIKLKLHEARLQVDSQKVFNVFGMRLFFLLRRFLFWPINRPGKDTNSTKERVLAWQVEIKQGNTVLCGRKARTVNVLAGRCTMVPTVFEMEERIREARFVHSSKRQKEERKKVNGDGDHSLLKTSLSWQKKCVEKCVRNIYG